MKAAISVNARGTRRRLEPAQHGREARRRGEQRRRSTVPIVAFAATAASTSRPASDTVSGPSE